MNAKASSTKGEVTETLGALTGDRRTEAQGRAEQRAADPDDSLAEVTDAAVEQETHEVRQEHHDIPRS